MLILGVDSSATAASAALVEDGRLLGEFFVNIKQTHSQTLLPMVQGLLGSLDRACQDVDVMAVSCGPGSFTGVRIGISCVKGMALTNNTACCGVSTLEAIAYGGIACEGDVLCAVMDARCGQVYHGLFQVKQGVLARLAEDQAVSIDELSRQCQRYGSSLLLLGDGAALCHRVFARWGARFAPETVRFQRASSVAFLAQEKIASGEVVPPEKLFPTYLRLPRAERELKKRMERKELSQ